MGIDVNGRRGTRKPEGQVEEKARVPVAIPSCPIISYHTISEPLSLSLSLSVSLPLSIWRWPSLLHTRTSFITPIPRLHLLAVHGSSPYSHSHCSLRHAWLFQGARARAAVGQAGTARANGYISILRMQQCSQPAETWPEACGSGSVQMHLCFMNGGREQQRPPLHAHPTHNAM